MTPPATPSQRVRLTVSVVVYALDEAVLRQTLDSLLEAIDHLAPVSLDHAAITVVNNAGEPEARRLRDMITDLQSAYPVVSAEGATPHDEATSSDAVASSGDAASGDAPAPVTLALQSGHGNVGYGRGHNRVIREAESDFHLILNPDVTLRRDALAQGLRYLLAHENVVAAAPIITESGNSDTRKAAQSACKSYPTVADFLLRGFAPAWLRRRYHRRMARYEMKGLPANEPSQGIPIISGCFMLFRTAALRELEGFDPRYFLYFEDFDLSVRARRLGTLACLPAMRITHLGGNSARKGVGHILMFVRSGVRFFGTHGWRLW